MRECDVLALPGLGVDRIDAVSAWFHTWLDDDVIDTWPEGWNALAEFDTLPEKNARAGYDTALIGKYHLGISDAPQNGFNH
ncbi:MAG: hypothetical protein GY802_08450 [Gammaproteobacteria bacterium]|nr:hypothetical protein [Gammaproteobacteria bacterium]